MVYAMPIDTNILLRAYAMGVFPMADSRDDDEVFWVEPQMRAIIPLEGLKISKSLRKTIRQDRFEVTSDTAFEQVIALCAQSASDRENTWINADIEQAFIELHEQGHAHSVECWMQVDGERTLVGGLYGLALGRVFCGESMFSRATDASKVALVWLVARLRVGGYELLDTQFMTDHLATMGAVELPQSEYLKLLENALSHQPSTAESTKSSNDCSLGSSGSGTGSGLVTDGNGSSGAVSGSSTAGASASGAADSGAADSDGAEGSVGAERWDGIWGALEGSLSGSLKSGLVGADVSLNGGSVSPGKSIIQSLTQTS